MTPSKYERVRELFLAAREAPPEQRAAFLAQACGADDELRGEVESLLANDVRDDTFLQTPALGRSFAVRGPESLAEPGVENARRAGTGGPLPPVPLPAQVGQYRIIELMGQGGMGVVYRAEQENPRRTVALKVIRPGLQSGDLLRRFAHEAQVLGLLQHPGIAQVFEAGTADTGFGPQPFFAMELVRGRPLAEYAEAGRLDVRQRLELLAKVCDAVQHAHQKGVIHRDLKPANILVDDQGQPKILDFGVARATDADLRATTPETLPGQIIGTLAYMSPEQISGDPGRLDTRSDVYSLGVIGYELLTGRVPLDLSTKTIPQAARTIAEEEPPSLGTLNRAFRGDLATIVGKALEKDKDRRYQSASELAEDIRRFLADEPILARPATTFYQLHKFAKRNKPLVAGVLVAFVALVVGVIGTTTQAVRAIEERNRARAAEQIAEQRRAAAETEAQKVQTINEFINAMLASADPGREGRDVRVVDMLKRAAQELETTLASQPEIEAALRDTIGMTYLGLGQARDAEPHLRRALTTRLELLGPEHADTLRSMTNLGMVLLETGELAESADLLQRVLEARRRIQGAEHPQTLDAMGNFANALQRRGSVTEAEALWREALTWQRRVLSPDDPQLATVLNNLGQLLKQLRRPQEAEPLLREALEVYLATYGEEHPQTLATLGNLAMTLKSLRRDAEAETLLRRIVDVRRRTLGEHPALYMALSNLARVLEDQGRGAEAEPLAREALEGMRAAIGPEEESTLVAENNLASLLVALGRAAEAEPLYEELRAAAGRALPADHYTQHVFARNHGVCLTALGRYEEAEALLLASHDALLRILGSSHQHTRKTLECVIALYVAWGRAEEADAWRARLPNPQPSK